MSRKSPSTSRRARPKVANDPFAGLALCGNAVALGNRLTSAVDRPSSPPAAAAVSSRPHTTQQPPARNVAQVHSDSFSAKSEKAILISAEFEFLPTSDRKWPVKEPARDAVSFCIVCSYESIDCECRPVVSHCRPNATVSLRRLVPFCVSLSVTRVPCRIRGA